MAITKQELVERARAIAPGIAARAQQTEVQRKPHDDNIKEMVDAGLMPVLLPKRWGGHELGLDAHMEIVEVISSACMSTGWIAGFYMGHHFYVTKFSERAQADVFADGPTCLLPGTTNSLMKAKKVTGGWEISGRATWGSGIMHATWALVGADTDDGRRVFLIPASDTRFDDVWFMSGMAGTGSNDIVVDGAFVPEHRGLLMESFMAGPTEGSRIHENPFYSMPLMPFIYNEIAGFFSGGLAGAVDAFETTIKKRVITHSEQATRERPQNHIQLGSAIASSIVAKELARSIVRQTMPLIGGEFDLETRLRLKAQAGFLADHCRRTINEMMNRSGATNFQSSAPLQRFFRDVNTVAIHAYWDWEVAFEQLGRHRVGLAPNNPLV
ncbi:acyl-CoA dehydrogenase family protein [Sphingobium sp. CFD-2]|uniref:acyl-CoA dehydrogenase family protein n=1 Tax=Sphingobium sp. CFD-2 TaxID=2878542 RepID=UPI00214C0C60|nr:acyl-CoA dehydrogenase family protein [Sphingobium sp. CFD-2]